MQSTSKRGMMRGSPIANRTGMQFKITRGLNIPISGEPEQRVAQAPPVARVALVGYDYIGVKRLPTLEVSPGDRVRLGQPLARGKAFSEVVGTAPGTGVVEAIHRGPKRVLETVVIRLDDPAADPDSSDQETFNAYPRDELATLSRAQVRENLLASGSWLALRTRPYGMIPPPDRAPDALFVTAIDTNPLAPDPRPLIEQSGEDFADGLTVLGKLTDGPVYVCTAAGFTPTLPAGGDVRHAQFAGPHPAGLVGTHIHFLRPVGLARSVWHLGWQEVIAIARLFKTGRLDPSRVVSLAGPMVREPRLIRTRLGASTNELIRGELQGDDEARVISGSILEGRHAVGNSAFLGRFHNQVTVVREGREREWLGWIMPGRNKFSALNVFVSALDRLRAFPLSTSQNGSPRAMVPIGAYERVMPLDILPTQLLRALLVNDTETALALGALELVEEDLALCSFVDCGKHDFGPVLRRNLNKIRAESQ